MNKSCKVEVQKGPIKPRDPMSENYKNMSRSQCDQKDYHDRMERRRGQELEYEPTHYPQ
jgi:hypothetical protein